LRKPGIAVGPERSTRGAPAAMPLWYRTLESALRSSWPLERLLAPRNDGRFVHNATFSYHPPFRPFRYHPNAARSPLKPIETASGCWETAQLLLASSWDHRSSREPYLGRCVS